MCAHFYANEVQKTKRYLLGERLGASTRNLLLMTATPHAGKPEDFELWLALLDGDRFEGKPRDGAHTADTSDLMRRMVKEKLLRFDGTALFPPRWAYTVPYPLSDLERALYDAVTAYVKEGMTQADALREGGDRRRGNVVGFALTVLQRRLASSPEAIYQSLSRRRQRLERKRQELIARSDVPADVDDALRRAERLLAALQSDDVDGLDELDDGELEAMEEAAVDDASVARTVAELATEIESLRRLEELALRVRLSEIDRKWQELSALFDRSELRAPDGRLHKLIVFTEHRDTLNYLQRKISDRLGDANAVVAIHGGNAREQRRVAQERFREDPSCLVLVATDAAGEGVNLQRAHLMVNYDLPWNPNRLEQRFGRIHRIGQTEHCHCWNLLAEGTREGDVYQLLLRKLDKQREALGTDQVFDVIGEAFRGRPLRDLLIEAIRFGDDPLRKAELDRVIDERVGDGLAELVRENALATDLLDRIEVDELRRGMEEAGARSLQPLFVQAFFLEAFERAGGRLAAREPGRFEVTRVPLRLREHDRQLGTAAPLMQNYERICFDSTPGQAKATLVCPGHPLLDSVVQDVIVNHDGVLRDGTVFIDDGDRSDAIRVLVGFEHAIRNGHRADGRERTVVSQRFEFVYVEATGTCHTAGSAPYLDFRPASVEEQELIRPHAQALLGDSRSEIEAEALTKVVDTSARAHLTEIRDKVLPRLERVRHEVQVRLTNEIKFWEDRTRALEEQASAGKQPKMNPDRARARTEELIARLNRRMKDLQAEAQLTSTAPVLVAMALVVPAGLLQRLVNGDANSDAGHSETLFVALSPAEERVVELERAAGNVVDPERDDGRGGTIRSTTPAGALRLIAVVERPQAGDDVRITRTRLLTALNAPDLFWLALVDSTGPAAGVRFVPSPFEATNLPPLAQTSITLSWERLAASGQEA